MKIRYIVTIILLLQLTAEAQLHPTLLIKQSKEMVSWERPFNLPVLIMPKSTPGTADIKLPTSLPHKNIPLNFVTNPRPLPSTTGANTLCFDTSIRLAFRNDSLWVSNDYITKTRDGNVLIPGFDLNPKTFHCDAHLIKCNQQGDTIWSRSIQGGFPDRFFDMYKVFELADNSLLLAGNMDIPMPINGRQDPVLIRLTSSGNLIWQKTFKTKIWDVDTTRGSIDILGCQQDASGDIYLAGDIRTDASPRTTLACKMDLSGNILWSNSFTNLVFPICEGIDIKNNRVTFFGRTIYDNMINPVAIVMDKITGDSLYTVAFKPSVSDFWSSFSSHKMVKLQNGNIALYGPGTSEQSTFDSTKLNTHAGWIELTPNLEVVQAGLIKGRSINDYGGSVITIFEDGSGAYHRSKYLGNFSTDAIYGSFQNGLIRKERLIRYRGQFVSWTSNFLKLDDGGQLVTTYFGDSIAHSFFEFMRLHDSDTSGSCIGSDTVASFIEPQYYQPHHYADFSGRVTNVLEENQRPFKGVFNNSFNITSNCKQVSFCDSFRLRLSNDTVCVNAAATIKVTKNKECGTIPIWNYDTTVVSFFYPINDSMISIVVSKPWQGSIFGAIKGCAVLMDSVNLIALQAPSSLDLGGDTALCAGNTILLNAKNGYSTYRWQDGSTDSTFLVTLPGAYFVTTTNACGDTFSDTLKVLAKTSVAFDLGPNISICKNDSASITAPPGFIKYQWTSYNINNDTSQMVSVFPDTSRWYKLIAEKTPGCFVVDSLYISVKSSPTINLGNDTSFCESQIITLNAGVGFDSYEWSNGANSNIIEVSQPGTYVVRAASNGCFSYDTLKVLKVYPLPVFSLGSDTSLCEKQPLRFTFNLPQANYLWSTGNTLSSITITSEGKYWLKVIQQGCTKTDTVVLKYKINPKVNLGNDSTLCENETIQLKATNPNATYIWQNGNTTPGFLVNKAGLYYVRVDIDNCAVSDSIEISYKKPPVFSLGKDSFLCNGQQYTLKSPFNAGVNHLWQDGSSAPNFTVTKEGLYSLQINNECGSYTDSVIINTGLCDIEMPTAFTPNGDGLNDFFKVKYPFATESFNMRIFNRFGEMVFESNNISAAWDGRWKGEVLPGAYVWAIKYTPSNKFKKTLKGTVIVLR